MDPSALFLVRDLTIHERTHFLLKPEDMNGSALGYGLRSAFLYCFLELDDIRYSCYMRSSAPSVQSQQICQRCADIINSKQCKADQNL